MRTRLRLDPARKGVASQQRLSSPSKQAFRCASCGAPARAFPDWALRSVWTLLSSPCAVEEFSVLSCEDFARCASLQSVAVVEASRQTVHGWRGACCSEQTPPAAGRDECKFCLELASFEAKQSNAFRRLAEGGSELGLYCVSLGSSRRSGFLTLGVSQCALRALSDASRSKVLAGKEQPWEQRLGAARLCLCLSSSWTEALAESERALFWPLGGVDQKGAALDNRLTQEASCHFFALAVEALRFFKLPLSLHPKAAELWALRRSHSRRALRLALSLPGNGRSRGSPFAESGCCCGLFQRETALLPALQEECQESEAGREGETLFLKTLKAELEFCAFHLRHRLHSAAAAEHAHRLLSENDDDEGAAPKSVQTLERKFWRDVAALAPFHFAGGHYSLRLLERDLRALLRTQPAQGAREASGWMAGQVKSCAARRETNAVARVAETIGEASKVAALFPKAEAPLHTRLLAMRALFDFASEAALQTARAARQPVASAERLLVQTHFAATREALAECMQEEEKRFLETESGVEGCGGRSAAETLRNDFRDFCTCLEQVEKTIALHEGQQTPSSCPTGS